MFLKSMETIGFKSFAERVQVQFFPGITAIVGPNGSGKSNVIDAIRWVLGEQSARSLRGQRMEDIIFQGSDTRKALNFAEVSLTLNNENRYLPLDYQEVTVMRRVYRSGESEFFINKQPCRLKDIVDLFTDTGLGRESFSIIGQGKIDEILNAKAEERRVVFEEAAGVMKYKQRKHRATYKLSETEANLNRVEDIIYEINQQLQPLEKQAEKAKQFKNLKEQLTHKEIALLTTEISNLNDQLTALHKEIEQRKLEEIKEKTVIQKQEANILQAREKLQNDEVYMQQLQQHLLELTEQLEKNEGRRNVLIEQRKHVQENEATLTSELNRLEQEASEKDNQLNQVKQQINHLIDELQNVSSEMKTIETSLYDDHRTLEAKIENLKADYIERLNEQAVMQNEQLSLKKQSEQIEQLIAKHKYEHESVLREEQTLNAEETKLTEKLLQYKNKQTLLEQTFSKIKASLENKQQAYKQVQNDLYKYEQQRTKLISRQEMLLEMKESFEGYAYGVKEILKAKQRGQLKQIAGAVIDLIDVPAKYMVAIDTILGAQAQYVVVTNDQIAIQTIEWLKKENKGRATFLPLHSVAPRKVPPAIYTKLKQYRYFLGLGSELVETEANYARVIEYLMGNVIVTDTIEHAAQLNNLTGKKYRIVTLEGDVIYPGGTMSGGVKRKITHSLFTREKEISELKGTLQTLANQIEQTNRTKQQIEKEIINLQRDAEKNEVQRNTLNREQQQLAIKHNELTIRKQSLQNRLKAYHYQMNEFENESEAVKQSRSQTKHQLEKLNGSIEQLAQAIEVKVKQQEEAQKNEKTLENHYHQLQVRFAELDERRKNFDQQYETFQHENERLQRRIDDINNQLAELDDPAHMAEKLEQIKLSIEQLNHEREEVKIELQTKTTEREQLLRKIEDEESELKGKKNVHEQFVHQIQKLEVEAGRLDVMLDNRLNTLQKEYIITFEKAKNSYEPITDIDKVRQEVSNLKQSIQAIGTVYLGAIEEHERLTERMTFLIEQQNDLIEAKQTLFDAIKEMDEEMIARFKTMFDKIQHAFTDVFKQLFGGGEAQLVLTNPDDYLETGIDIVARPPGKKLKNLELLSGGERALTAIALLFSILKARHVPFVILDEVDAALDEANVERFARYLKTFSKESQFVVISHRKGTMEEADALYGVTMQESGVSRFVSVKLEETDDLVSVT